MWSIHNRRFFLGSFLAVEVGLNKLINGNQETSTNNHQARHDMIQYQLEILRNQKSPDGVPYENLILDAIAFLVFGYGSQ